MTESESDGLVPVDSFGARLAVVKALMGWNYDQAQTATGVNSESWRLWERGRHCTDMIGVSRKIAQATGVSQRWLVFGGPLRQAEEGPLRRRAKKAANTGSHTRVSLEKTGRLMSSTRVLTRDYLLCDNVAAA